MANDVSQNESLKGKKFVIVHGYTASPEKNWFPWLKAELASLGALVYVPEMPEPLSPEPLKWQQHLKNLAIEIDENTLFIGHSLGCVTVLRFLEQQVAKGNKVGGYILVAGFDQEQRTLPELKPHTLSRLDYPYLIDIADKRISIISTNDWVVSPQSSQTLAKALQTEVIIEEEAGHFLDREGYTEFPTLLHSIKTQFNGI
ncbi:RBBP9/YdeN family alpha/beta hydrolase [Providencia stuartii]|uniref:RBBP9/YdeN family alpha/beta hydrolase n=1 Tax=Providencia stuartii TaxID=588 RepID=UPI00288DA6FB|nr:alpha/beta hydrolase [Providencia stuartii]MDT2014304.1 alpha/beta hydrolase [Providencia stuartii]MDT2082417.1 alpha/beta hydrolase [Providencia stuartii]HEM6870421.1 serine hydrolase family protein [Providencia stuartii]HEM7174360.1 serine hydrolase family protein [Providencia stuartii]